MSFLEIPSSMILKFYLTLSLSKKNAWKSDNLSMNFLWKPMNFIVTKSKDCLFKLSEEIWTRLKSTSSKERTVVEKTFSFNFKRHQNRSRWNKFDKTQKSIYVTISLNDWLKTSLSPWLLIFFHFALLRRIKALTREREILNKIRTTVWRFLKRFWRRRRGFKVMQI